MKTLYNADRLRIFLTIIAGLALLTSLFGVGELLPCDPSWVAIVLCGIPIVLHAGQALLFERNIKADTLVSLALIGALWLGEYFAAGEVAFIMQIGSILEDYTAGKARREIEKLLKLKPQTARIKTDSGEQTVPVEQVVVGNRLIVLAGETIPVDGIILSGSASVDQSSMTGESIPVDKVTGDEVAGGTTNIGGVFEMQALRPENESFLQRVIRLVDEANVNKAKIVARTDRWATWMVLTAFAISLATGLITAEPIRAVTVLVVFCPCAFVLATPTAIMAGIGNATRYGILVRSGDSLERFANITDIAFDKTGTLTVGKPTVTVCESIVPHWSKEELFRLAASAELRSEHPLGKAILETAQHQNIVLDEPKDFKMVSGQGIQATVKENVVQIGNAEFLQANGISLSDSLTERAKSLRRQGATTLFVAVDNSVIGLLALSDTLRDSSKATIIRLKKEGIEPVLLTGDSREVALYLANQLGIDQVHAELLPEDKLAQIVKLEADHKNICMTGDGINDAPALRAAHAGIAMGKIGSDIAVESSDAVLIADDLRQIPYLFQLAKKTMRTINSNIVFSLGLNLLAVILAALGILNPVWGALVHNAGSVAVVLNSILLFSAKDSN